MKPYDHSVRCDEEEGCELLVDVFEAEGNIKRGYTSDSNKSRPIELSPEWLVKFGFEKKIILGNADGYWYQRSGLSYNEKHQGWWFRGSFPDGPKYVHQLQNLYFWLTMGEELTIKSFNQSN